MKKITLFIILLIFGCQAKAQTVLEVISKTIEKTVPYTAKGTITIGGENASIKIDTWEKDDVKIKMKLISKHRIKSVAISELENIKYIADKKGNDIYLRDYFLTSSDNTGSGSILKVEYELTVPVKSNFIIKNNIGNIDIKNTDGSLSVEAKFGNVNLYNITGDCSLDLSVGDILMNKINSSTKIKANHSNIDMEKITGKYTLKLTNSDLSFKPIDKVELLDIESKNGDISCTISGLQDYNYSFTNSYGEIKLPDLFNAQLTKEKNKSIFERNDKNNKAFIKIKSEFGNIVLTK